MLHEPAFGTSNCQPSHLLIVVEQLDTACKEVGRDIESIEVQEGMLAVYPDQVPLDEESKARATPVGGIAADLRKLEMLGVDHAVCLVQPPTSAALARLADELHAYRRATAR